MTIAAFTVLTGNDVANQVSANGLGVLGVSAPMLSLAWSSANAGTLDDTTLQLPLTNILAPFTGIWEVQQSPVRYSGPDGQPYTSSAGVLALHPEAVHRLESLVTTRLDSLNRPVAVAMLVHGVAVPSGQVMQWYRPGDPIGVSGNVTFHDRRGLIIDPLAVAAMFADLLTWRPGLSNPAFNATTLNNGTGGAGAIAAAATAGSIRVHVVTPHGAAYQSRRTGSEVQVLSGATVVQDVPSSGLVDLASGQSLGRPAATPPAQSPVLWGVSPNGVLGDSAWSPPSLSAGVNLQRQFFRLMAVDLNWHLLGNRAFVPGDSDVPAEDDYPANAPLPVVRRSLANFAYLVDGNDVLGAMGAMVSAWPAAADRPLYLASPHIDTTLALPAAPGAAGHWPATPGIPAPPPGAPALVRAFDPVATAPTAAWRSVATGEPRDVIVTIPAAALPPGTHVRIFPRTFQVIRGIGEDPSFVRGDGGSAIVPASGPTAVLLVNPFNLGSSDSGPAPDAVTVDIVCVAQDNTRRLVSSVEVLVGSPQAWTDNTASFGGTAAAEVAGAFAGDGFTSIAPAGVFGIPWSGTPPAAPHLGDSFTDWVTYLTNEGNWPRVGPHLPSQTRFETVLALGAQTAVGAPYVWSAALSGARYDWESRCASPELGDPGNPAGPDTHITGVRVGGQLAYDLAFHALKRCQSVVPTNSPPTTGWTVVTSGDNWNEPPQDPAPSAGQPFLAGAMLETISSTTDSPELSLLPVPSESDTIQSLIDTIVAAMGLPRDSVHFSLHNEDRLRHQLQREIATATRGQRDAMWSLARAIKEAREYIYIESPSFQRTAQSGDAHLVDLVQLVRDRLEANPRLKVMICIPRLPDFLITEQSWVRAVFRDRKAAIEALTGGPGGANVDRVAAFHPIGFPGRSTVGRSTVVLVDDVYASVGTSHWRRRGMTLDGGCDVVSLDRQLENRGVGRSIATFRQQLLATRLGIPTPSNAASSSALWTRLAEPESAFDLVADLLRGGGLGRCSAVYAGPTDTSVIPEDVNKTDPNGLTGPSLPALLGGLAP